MFKYVWIIMLIILGLLLIGYTAWCIYCSYDYYVQFCERYKEPMTVGELVRHIGDDLFTDHLFLLSIWIVIILSILVLLFLSSLGAYCSKAE